MNKKNEQYEYKVPISNVFFGRFARACSCLDVSQNSLANFLIYYGYDKLMLKPLEKNTLVDAALKAYHQDARKNSLDKGIEDKATKNLTILTIRVKEINNRNIETLADGAFSKKDLIVALLWRGMNVISGVLANYQASYRIESKNMFSYETEKKAVVNCLGIVYPDFSRIAEAFALYSLTENTLDEILCSPEFVNAIVNQEEQQKKRQQTKRRQKQRLNSKNQYSESN